MKLPVMNKEELQQRNRLGMVSMRTTETTNVGGVH